MFTGLVADVGTVASVDRSTEGVRLSIETELAGSLRAGDSVAVNGVCLTAAAVSESGFQADVMNQTLSLSSLGDLASGSPVNLELALRADERLGGHVVQGHVDGLGRVVEVRDDGFARRLRVDLEEGLERYLVAHGSIALDGVSLTVAEIDGRSFTVSLIPETLQRTNLDAIKPGNTVNLEVDVLAKYVEKAVSVMPVPSVAQAGSVANGPADGPPSDGAPE
jgi:riboflavin synthase